MIQFVARRTITTILVLFGVLIVVFVLLRCIPGDPWRAIQGEQARDEIRDAFIERNRLNEPIPEQFITYLTRIIRGDLDVSFRYGRPVLDLFLERLPTTIELAFTGLIFAIVVGIPLGIISAYRRNSIFDLGTMTGAAIGVSMPVFWLGLMLAFFFGVLLADTPFALPPSGRLTPGALYDPFYVVWGLAATEEQAGVFLVFLSRFHVLNAILTFNFGLMIDAIRHLILPALTVSAIPLAIISRMTRSSLLDVLSQDYILYARSKGLSEFMVVMRHGMRNALMPVITVIGLCFAALLSGAVLTETIFGLSGVGSMLVESISARDYPLIQGFTLLIALMYVIVNFIVDVMYFYLDPRIQLE